MVKLGLRAKFFLYSNTVIGVTIAVAVALAVMHDRQGHYEAARRHARQLAAVLAIPITDALMYEDLGLVSETGLTDNYISEILLQDPERLRYVMVANPEGTITHSNRWSLLGQRFDRALGAEAIPGGAIVEERLDGKERLLEVRYPLHIASKFWGSVSLGYSLMPIEQELADFKWRLIQTGLLLMLANSVLTAIYVESLIRPILRLNETMKEAGEGNLASRVWTSPGDEVGELGAAFNRMMDQLEEAGLRERVQQAQLAHTEKMAAVGALAAGVAHEVNNPLAGILNCIENMQAEPDNREMRERYLVLIHDGLRRIERTVVNLLDFSRRRELRLEPTSVNNCIRHVVELVDYQLRKQRVTLELDLDQDEPAIQGDRFQLEQLFLNLTLNALQAMPQGGTLTTRTRRIDGVVTATVEDTGVGVPAAIRDRIFDPFFTTRAVGEGTGLGLSVSDRIVTAHGGRIEVESTPGSGSVFRVVLPARLPARTEKEIHS
ncbi:MAG: HAMP domain-containing protein [Vicinamibacteraceae bacterium]|nr:HAMP domain-containing protein [Vicinamibacteraceae bacterium]